MKQKTTYIMKVLKKNGNNWRNINSMSQFLHCKILYRRNHTNNKMYMNRLKA